VDLRKEKGENPVGLLPKNWSRRNGSPPVD
jgi:hypothetical protein